MFSWNLVFFIIKNTKIIENKFYTKMILLKLILLIKNNWGNSKAKKGHSLGRIPLFQINP